MIGGSVDALSSTSGEAFRNDCRCCADKCVCVADCNCASDSFGKCVCGPDCNCASD